MKKTSNENIEISELIGIALRVSFTNEEYSLCEWGEVDNYTLLTNGVLILIECEKGQKHPNTNVLKLFPYLEDRPNIKILLVQYFYPKNKAPKNRLALCEYLGEKMERDFNGRFSYISLRCERDMIVKEVKARVKGNRHRLLSVK